MTILMTARTTAAAAAAAAALLRIKRGPWGARNALTRAETMEMGTGSWLDYLHL
jgi:hypothetical protein